MKKNPNVEEFYQLIDNDFFMKYMNYYHGIGTVKLNMSHSFNILICGPAGVGKSSFINQFLQEKQAKEGERLSVTF